MPSLEGYDIGNQVFEDRGIVYFQATRTQDALPVLIKTSKSDFPSTSEQITLKREFKLFQEFDHPHLLQALEEIKVGKTHLLVLEGDVDHSLREMISQGPMGLDEFLPLAIQMAELLSYIHNHGYVHQNLQPDLFYLHDDLIKLVDLSKSMELPLGDGESGDLTRLHGYMTYSSPEQTGRMSKSVDYRTDFYSLGVIFYEMLGGQPPFSSEDPLELIHAHIAKTPDALHQLSKDLPEAISLIVQKMLAKNRIDRYQSDTGLLTDLKMFQTLWQEQQGLQDFSPGLYEEYRRFSIPQKLYGRKKEIDQLIHRFDQTQGQAAQLVLVYGYSGIGKSALINMIHRPVVERKGYFLSGKFDQYRRNIPYASLIQAFKELIHFLLTLSNEQVADWRKKLLEAMGANAGVMTEVIPELELIMGEQPAPQALPPAEAENRFFNVFLDFIQVFTQPEHPIVLFLDDLQWADIGSLNLVKFILTQTQIHNLLLIGAYRDNEVTEGHPLLLTLNELAKAEVIPENIELSTLNLKHVNLMISETLHLPEALTLPLAELVHEKTQGNPFFLRQFLKNLYEQGLVFYDQEIKNWQWELEQIQSMGLTDNVIELLTQNLDRLPEKSISCLRLAACIGSEFELDMLATVSQSNILEVFQDLKPVIQEQLLLPQGQQYSQLDFYDASLLDDQPGSASDLKVILRFLHDRVQQAAYSLIPEDQRKKVHLSIGRMLVQNLDGEELEDKLFDVLGHLNQGIHLIEDPEEKQRVAQLNLEAGIKAKKSASYNSASRFLAAGIELLGPNCWDEAYELAIDLYTERAECEYLGLNYDTAEHLFAQVLEHARSKYEKLKIYHIQNLLYTKIGKTVEALEVGRKAMKLYGIRFPRRPLLLKIGAFAQVIGFKLRQFLAGRDIEDLYNWKISHDPAQIAISGLLMDMNTSAYQSEMDLMPMIAMKKISLSMKHGLTPPSAYAYGSYAVIIGSGLGQFKQGFEYGKMAVRMSQRVNSETLKWKIPFVFLTFISHWREHMRKSLDPYFEVLKGCQINGDQVFEGYCMAFYFWKRMATGDPLPQVFEDCESFVKILNKSKDYISLHMMLGRFQSLKLLLGKTPGTLEYNDEGYEEGQTRRAIDATGNRTVLALHLNSKLQYHFLLGTWEKGLEIAQEMEPYEENLLGLLAVAEYFFYYSLLLLVEQPSAPKGKRARLKVNLGLKGIWMRRFAQNSPENFKHQHLLLKAEKARIRGQVTKAMDLYEAAIQHASEHGFLQDEAIANERAAVFYLDLDKPAIAQLFLREAYYLFDQWGAVAKTQQLKDRYPEFLGDAQSKSAEEASGLEYASTDATALDIFTIVKASAAISREINLEKLLDNLLQIIMENAGAQNGSLVLEREGGLWITTRASVGQTQQGLKEAILMEGSGLLPESIIRLVARTHEAVVLHNAFREDTFRTDPYVQEKKPKSVLCSPILNQGRLLGLVYLENNLSAQAFHAQRIEVVKILTGQAAISIENASLYEDMNRLNLDLKEEVHQRKTAQEALFSSEQRLKQYLEAVPVGISVLDAEGKPFFINRMAQEILGKDIDPELSMEQLSEAYQLYKRGVPEHYPARDLPIVKALLHGETSMASDLEVRRNNVHIPIEAIATPHL